MIEPELLKSVVRTIVSEPEVGRVVERVGLFGSAYQERMTAKSDIDLLVSVPEGENREKVLRGLLVRLDDNRLASIEIPELTTRYGGRYDRSMIHLTIDVGGRGIFDDGQPLAEVFNDPRIGGVIWQRVKRF